MADRTALEDRVTALLRARGLRMTPQRRAIVGEILRSEGHISPSDLVERVQRALPGVNPSTVYRTLDVLEEAGVLAHAHLEGGPEYHRAEEAAHVHLACSRCGSGEDLSPAEERRIVAAIERAHGFEADLTHFAISGLCARCRGRAGRGASTRR